MKVNKPEDVPIALREILTSALSGTVPEEFSPDVTAQAIVNAIQLIAKHEAAKMCALGILCDAR